MTQLSKLVLATGLMATSFAAPAIAESHGNDVFTTFYAAQDTNGNGTLSMNEMRELGEAVFSSMDYDDNRKISADEFASWDIGFIDQAEQAGRMDALVAAMTVLFFSYDADGDKALSKREWGSLHVTGTQKADADDNGQLTAQELWTGFPVFFAIRTGLGE